MVLILTTHADHTLTVANVLSVLEGVNLSMVKGILQSPLKEQSALRKQYPDDSQYKEALVKYYLKTEPFASWENIAGQCLCDGIDSAFQRTQSWLKPLKGMTLTPSKQNWITMSP